MASTSEAGSAPSSASGLTELHSWTLANVLGFLDLDSLSNCTLCCSDWHRCINNEDTVWRLIAEHAWPRCLPRVAPLVEAELACEDVEMQDVESPLPYSSFKELVLDRNSRFAVPCMQLGLQLRHERRSMASPRSRNYFCCLEELVWDRANDEICAAFTVDGDSGKVRMPVTTFLFRRILDDHGNKYDDINVSPPCRTRFEGEQGSFRGVIAWKAEDIFQANTALVSRCEASHLIAKVPPERVSGVRLSLCFGLPCQGPVAVVGTMMDQDDACGPLDLITSSVDRKALDKAFSSRFDGRITFKRRNTQWY